MRLEVLISKIIKNFIFLLKTAEILEHFVPVVFVCLHATLLSFMSAPTLFYFLRHLKIKIYVYM